MSGPADRYHAQALRRMYDREEAAEDHADRVERIEHELLKDDEWLSEQLFDANSDLVRDGIGPFDRLVLALYRAGQLEPALRDAVARRIGAEAERRADAEVGDA
jgi:hypothetical protein